jgi:hypothetical protein
MIFLEKMYVKKLQVNHVLQPKEYHISLKDFQSSLRVSAKARKEILEKIFWNLDQLKIVLVVDYVMVYKIRDSVRISSTKQVVDSWRETAACMLMVFLIQSAVLVNDD